MAEDAQPLTMATPHAQRIMQICRHRQPEFQLEVSRHIVGEMVASGMRPIDIDVQDMLGESAHENQLAEWLQIKCSNGIGNAVPLCGWKIALHRSSYGVCLP